MTETFDLRIDSIAAGGDGVGRHDGIVVFVPRTAPGDVARVEARQEGRLMRGRVLSLVSSSADRAVPRCHHYESDDCGGCQLQHLGYDAQLRAKSHMVRDALARIGRVTVDAPVVVSSEEQWRYRRKLTLALRPNGDGWLAGMRRWDNPDAVFRLIDCEITDPAVIQAWRAVLAQSQLLPADKSLRAAVRQVSQGFSLTVEGGARWESHGEFCAALPALAELWWKPRDRRRRLLFARDAKGAAGAAFAQVNPDVAARLVDWVVALVRPVQPMTAVDAYSGTGDIAAALAGLGARLTAIEVDRVASRVCGVRLPAGSRAVTATVEQALPNALPADVIVVNPPRAGLSERVVEHLQRQTIDGRRQTADGDRAAESREPRDESHERTPQGRLLIYVSCNPATLARDLRRLDRYRLASVRAFDMFPQTAHVETVCAMEPLP